MFPKPPKCLSLLPGCRHPGTGPAVPPPDHICYLKVDRRKQKCLQLNMPKHFLIRTLWKNPWELKLTLNVYPTSTAAANVGLWARLFACYFLSICTFSKLLKTIFNQVRNLIS